MFLVYAARLRGRNRKGDGGDAKFKEQQSSPHLSHTDAVLGREELREKREHRRQRSVLSMSSVTSKASLFTKDKQKQSKAKLLWELNPSLICVSPVLTAFESPDSGE